MKQNRDFLRSGPLTSTQQTMYAISQNERASAKMNLSYSLLLSGNFQPEIFERALSFLVQKHEALRTRYEADEEGEIRAFVEAAWMPDIEVVDCVHLNDFEKQRICQNIYQHEQEYNFNLADAKQIRVKIAELGVNKWMAFITLNHISADAWGLKILCKDWSNFYNHILNSDMEQAAEFADQTIQTIDVAKAELSMLTSSEMKQLIQEHQSDFLGGSPLLSSSLEELRYDFERYPVPYLRDSRIVSEVPETVVDSMHILKAQFGISDFAIFLAGFVLAIARWQESDVVALGSLTANRSLPGASKVLGALYNSAYYIYTNFSHLNARAYLQKTEEICYNVHKYQSLPFTEIAKTFTEITGSDAELLSQIMIYMDEFPMDDLVLNGCDVDGYHFDPAISETVSSAVKPSEADTVGSNDGEASDFADNHQVTRLATVSNAILSLFVRRGKQNQSVSFFYKTDLISDATASKLLRMTFNNIIQLEEDPEQNLDDFL